jgi:CRP-like cAMP-binding protein
MEEMGNFEKDTLFDQLDENEEKHIMEKFQTIRVPAGEYVFRENDPGDTLYIVEEGMVSLKKIMADDYEKTMFVAHAGLVFGEFSFIDGKKRSASARAENDSVLKSLKRNDFDAFIQKQPLTGVKFYNNLLKMIVERLRQTNESYKDAICWGLEATGTQKLNFQNIITENINIRLELAGGRVLEGRILQLEQSEAGYEVIVVDKSGYLSLVPYHAITTVSASKS